MKKSYIILAVSAVLMFCGCKSAGEKSPIAAAQEATVQTSAETKEDIQSAAKFMLATETRECGEDADCDLVTCRNAVPFTVNKKFAAKFEHFCRTYPPEALNLAPPPWIEFEIACLQSKCEVLWVNTKTGERGIPDEIGMMRPINTQTGK